MASLVECQWPIPTRLLILLNRQQPPGCVLAKCSVSGLGPAFGSPDSHFLSPVAIPVGHVANQDIGQGHGKVVK